MKEGSERQEEREGRIAELEERLHRRSLGVRPWVAAICLAGGLFLLWMYRADIAYFFAPLEPVTLGHEGAYLLNDIPVNRYVQLHGTPTARAAFGFERSGAFVVVGLKGTPFLVRRDPLPGEQWRVGQKPPPPSQTPFGVRGRLISRAQARMYQEAFSFFEHSSELRPQDGALYLVVQGARPRGDWGVPLGLSLGTAFVAFNAWMLLRALLSRA